MKTFLIVFLALISAVACSMAGKSRRLTSEVDISKLHWYPCTSKMVPAWRGKLCLVDCEIKLKKDGTCKKGKYKYTVKNFHDEHEFFSNMYMTPNGMVY